jgi:hypothetical protein
MPAVSLPVSLYLDVDGVVSPFGPSGTSDWGSPWQIADAGLLEVAFAVELVDELNELSRREGARFVWLTSWEDLAPRFLCPAIGLHGQDWPVLLSRDWPQAQWWKLAALQHDVESSGSERLVWMDDQLDYEPAAQAWAAILGQRKLLISPDPRRGLSPKHIRSVRQFLGPILP